MRAILFLFFSAALSALASSATAQDGVRVVPGGLYIASDGFSIEQAMKDAARETKREDNVRFFVLVLGKDVQKLTLGTPTYDFQQSIYDTLNRGGEFLVCERDLRTYGVKSEDLISFVQVVQGWSSAQDNPTLTDGVYFESEDPLNMPVVYKQQRRIRALCAEENRPPRAGGES